MAKKPLQFNVPENFRQEIEKYVKGEEVTLSEFLRQSVKIYLLLKRYNEKGYKLILRKEDDPKEKEIILT